MFNTLEPEQDSAENTLQTVRTRNTCCRHARSLSAPPTPLGADATRASSRALRAELARSTGHAQAGSREHPYAAHWKIKIPHESILGTAQARCMLFADTRSAPAWLGEHTARRQRGPVCEAPRWPPTAPQGAATCTASRA